MKANYEIIVVFYIINNQAMSDFFLGDCNGTQSLLASTRYVTFT